MILCYIKYQTNMQNWIIISFKYYRNSKTTMFSKKICIADLTSWREASDYVTDFSVLSNSNGFLGSICLIYTGKISWKLLITLLSFWALFRFHNFQHSFFCRFIIFLVKNISFLKAIRFLANSFPILQVFQKI